MKTETKIIVFSTALGLATWFIDAGIHCFILLEGTYWESLVSAVSRHEIYMRSITVVAFVVFGVIVARVTAKHRRTERALREASARNEAILAAVPDIMAEVDENKIYTWANPAGLQFFGDDMLGREAAHYFVGEQDTYDTVQPLFDGFDDVIYVESWQRRKDGEKRLLAWWCRVLKEADGKVRGTLTMARDITQSKRTEERLRLLSSAIEQSSEGIAVVNPDGHCLFVNSACASMHGYVPAELVGKHLSLFHRPEQIPAVDAAKRQVLERGTFQGEIDHVRRDGSVFPTAMHISLLRDDAGHPIGMIGTLRDISEQKLVAERFRLAAEMVTDLIYQWDVHDDSLEWFGNVDEALGYPTDEIPRTIEGWTSLIHPEDLNRLKDSVERHRTTMEPIYEEYRVRHRDGGWRYWIDRGTPVLDEQDRPIRWIGACIDITAFKQAQQEREKLIVELEAQNAELERFTYTVSHDLKSPLVTIKGYLGLVQEDIKGGDQEAIEDDLERMNRAADKMGQSLDELLELSRIGRMTHLPEEVALGELAREAVELVGGQIDQKAVQIDVSDDLPVVVGDRPRLLEVMQNLIDNAVKYMGDQPHPSIEIGARPHAEETICYVRDNGTGIDPRYHERVFGLFDQLDQTAEGSGIGLALVKRIVEVHGGRVWIESDGPGHGSTFCFALPRKTISPNDRRENQ